MATATLGQTGVDNYNETDEYGQPANPTADQPRYGWLGSHQRDTGNTIAGLILMGARLYGPVIGRFLSIDPVPGGNDNRYTYPGDPINGFDLDGECGYCKRRADGGGGYLGATFEHMPYGFPPGIDARSPGIYVVKTNTGQLYVGQSSNIGQRLKQHVSSKKITAKDDRSALRISIKGGKTRREVAEQRMKDILEREVKAQGGSLANKVNPIGKK